MHPPDRSEGEASVPVDATGAMPQGRTSAMERQPAPGIAAEDATAVVPDYLVTHSGGFHADELMSSVILTRLFPAARLIRSRDPRWITPADDRVIYDVGGAYDPKARIFDHHQRGAPLRGDGQPLSSFGLIWRHFGCAYLARVGIAPGHIATLHASFDRGFVLPVDLADNGAVSLSSVWPLAGMTLIGLLETLKPVFDDPDPMAEERGFQQGLTIARAFIEAQVAQSAAKLRAEAVVRQAIAAVGSGRVLELPLGMPFRAAISQAGADHLWFVVHPRKDDWCLTGIRRTEAEFALRADLPAHWAGLTDAALEAACGVPGASFCHNARFIATARTREAALAMADLAVRAALDLEAG